MRYRRVLIPGASYFFTVNLENRNTQLLIEQFSKLKLAFQIVKKKHPFRIDSMVILPEHLHLIMTLPQEDENYSQRLNLIKGIFSRQILQKEKSSPSRHRKRERGIWQRRFWEHIIRDEKDYEQHINYIHYNPVKHGYVKSPSDWKFSSIHQFIEKGILSKDWGKTEDFTKQNFGE